MRILHVVSELYPFVKTGGLADVAAALPAALHARGLRCRVLLPGYPAVLDALQGSDVVWNDSDLFHGGPARLLVGSLPQFGPRVYVLDCAGHYSRSGGPYQDADGHDWPDNALRFAALSWLAQLLAQGLDPAFAPDVLHAHDWQSGLAPAYLALGEPTSVASVITIHNLAYAGAFDPAVYGELSLPPEAYAVEGTEFYGRVSFLKAGLYYAQRITTVSPTYAAEIQTPAHGGGFEGLLHSRRAQLSGILNGVDYGQWSPENDHHLPVRYDRGRLDRKREVKRALQDRFGLAQDPDVPLFGSVSRLNWHKGSDLLLEVGDWLGEYAQLVVVGTGEPALQEGFRALAARHPGRIGVEIGYDESLSHLVQGGAEAFVVPSRSEPCGLTQLYAMRYGTVPVVRNTGGLADTVVHASSEALAARRATGVVFDEADARGLQGALAQALELHAQPARWRVLQQTGMAQDFSWARAAEHYIELYEGLVPAGKRELTA